MNALLALARSCFQCGRCSGGCPMAGAMDHSPRALLRLLQLGLVEDALRSNTPWLCATCYGCSVSCPRGIDLTGLMYRLRREAVARGVENESVWFYREFVDSLRKRGIVYEPELLLNYARRVGVRALLPHVRMGLRMAYQGKLSFGPRGIQAREPFREATAEALEQ